MEFLIFYTNYSAKPELLRDRKISFTHGNPLNVHFLWIIFSVFERRMNHVVLDVIFIPKPPQCSYKLSTLDINNYKKSTLTLVSCRKHSNEIFSSPPRSALRLGENHVSTQFTVKLVSKFYFTLLCRILLSGSWEVHILHCCIWLVKQVKDRKDFNSHFLG